MNCRKIIALLLSCAVILSVSVPSYALEPAADGTGTGETVSTEATEATEATEPTDTEETETTDPTESMEETEATDPTESTEETRSTEPTEGTAETEVTDPADPTEGTDTTDPTDATDATEATEPEADLSADAQSIIDWAGAISWDNQAAADALGRYKDLTADELAAFEQIMGYLYGLKEEYKEKYQAIYEALPAEEQAAVAEAYAAYSAVEAFIGQFEAVVYQTETLDIPDGVNAEPILSGYTGRSDTTAFYALYENTDGSGQTLYLTVNVEGGYGTHIASTTSSATAQPWSSYRNTITRVIIGAGITEIAPYALCGLAFSSIETEENTYFCVVDNALYSADMTRLISYSCQGSGDTFMVPKTVTTIDTGVFHHNQNILTLTFEEGTQITALNSIFYSSKVKKVVIPSSVITITTAFNYCQSLNEVVFEENSQLTTITAGAFSHTALKEITLPTSVVTIGGTAFSQSYDLKSINLSELVNLTTIGSEAFLSTAIAGDVVLPDSLTTIGKRSFQGANKITSIFIPASVTSIGDQAFVSMGAMQKFIVEEGNANYITVDDVLYTKDMTILINYPSSKELDSFVVPDTVTKLADYSFQHSSIQNITLPISMTTIGSYVFYYSEIKYINIEELINLTTVGTWAFKDARIETVVIPEHVTNFGYGAFADMHNPIYILTSDAESLSLAQNAFDSVHGSSAPIYVANEEVAAKVRASGVHFSQDLIVGYTITVPATITVDGDLGSVSIQGVAENDCTLSVIGSTVTMTDTVGNQLPAQIQLTPIDFRWGLHKTSLEVSWPENGCPAIGTWTGNIEYSVTSKK